jgi:hypothetical protein
VGKIAGDTNKLSSKNDVERQFTRPAEAIWQIKSSLRTLASTMVSYTGEQLRAAAELLDLEAAREVVETIRTTQPEMARGIDTLLNEYRFDRIVALCAARKI